MDARERDLTAAARSHSVIEHWLRQPYLSLRQAVGLAGLMGAEMTETEALCAELTATVQSDLGVMNPSSLEELQEAVLASARSLAPQMNPIVELRRDPEKPKVVMLGVTWSVTISD